MNWKLILMSFKSLSVCPKCFYVLLSYTAFQRLQQHEKSEWLDLWVYLLLVTMDSRNTVFFLLMHCIEAHHNARVVNRWTLGHAWTVRGFRLHHHSFLTEQERSWLFGLLLTFVIKSEIAGSAHYGHVGLLSLMKSQSGSESSNYSLLEVLVWWTSAWDDWLSGPLWRKVSFTVGNKRLIHLPIPVE